MFRSLVRQSTPHATRRRCFLRCATLAVLGYAALAGCGKHAQMQTRPAPYVQTTLASFGPVQPWQTLAGVIAPYQNVSIQSTLAEPADAVYVHEGDVVHKGEVLAQLDTADLRAQLAADLATAQSDQAGTAHSFYQGTLAIAQGMDALRQAQETLANDRTNLSRDQALLAHGYISQQAVDAQATLVRNDEAAVAAAQANVSANGSIGASGLQAAAVAQSRAQERVALAQAQQVRVQIAKATITSPIDGIVVNRNLNPGEYPGSRDLFTIQQMTPAYAVLHASSSQVAHIQTGAPATVSVAGGSGLQVSGRVTGVLNPVVPGSTDFIVKILLANAGGRLHAGMVVTGRVRLPVLRGVRVPETAFIDDNHDSLLTVSGDGFVHTASVHEIGGDGVTSVVSGISPGTRVVSNGQISVGSGEKVSYTR
jgi:HlyD family secretion protein